MLQSQLLAKTVQIAQDSHLLFLNSAADPFVPLAAQQLPTGSLTLAEDNIVSLHTALHALHQPAHGNTFPSLIIQHIPFHVYTAHVPPTTMDCAILNMLYQPGNAWTHYGLALAAYALKPGGSLYLVGAKERGVQTIARHMQEQFGNIETLEIHKGHRVVRSQQPSVPLLPTIPSADDLLHAVFAQGKLDEGTRLLIEALQVRATDNALDIGCGAGHLGLHIARLAPKGSVTMVDASLAAVAMTQQAIAQSGLSPTCSIRVLASDGVQAVKQERFDLVVTNPPFHTGSIQTTSIAEQFIREAATVLHPRGRFYLVANRFLKYEPVMRECFHEVEEVNGNTKYKVLLATLA